MWNVLSLYGSGTPQILIKVTQDYQIDLLAVQEVRGLGWSITEKDCRMYYSCDDEENIFGAGFIISIHIRSYSNNFKPIDKRLWVIRIRGEFINYSFPCAHAPTEKKSEIRKDR
jgi:hypothetical protein